MTLNWRHILLWISFTLLYLLGLSFGLLLFLHLKLEWMGIMALLVVGVALATWWARIYHRQLGHFQTLREPLRRQDVFWAMFYALLLLLVGHGYDWYHQWLGLPESVPENQQMLMMVMRQMPWLLGVYAVLIAPVLEELLFRGLLFSFFGDVRQRVRQFWGIAISSLLFALPHALPTQNGFILYYVMGVILAVCYCHRRQLKCTILAHVVNNAVGVLLMAYELS